MFLNPAVSRPKGKGKDVFDSLMNKLEDNTNRRNKQKRRRKQKEHKPWRNNGSKKEET